MKSELNTILSGVSWIGFEPGSREDKQLHEQEAENLSTQLSSNALQYTDKLKFIQYFSIIVSLTEGSQSTSRFKTFFVLVYVVLTWCLFLNK